MTSLRSTVYYKDKAQDSYFPYPTQNIHLHIITGKRKSKYSNMLKEDSSAHKLQHHFHLPKPYVNSLYPNLPLSSACLSNDALYRQKSHTTPTNRKCPPPTQAVSPLAPPNRPEVNSKTRPPQTSINKAEHHPKTTRRRPAMTRRPT
jgi:hypothetical protein